MLVDRGRGGGARAAVCMSETLLGRLIGVVVRPKLCVLAKTNPAGAGKQGKRWEGVGKGGGCTHVNVS